MSIFRVIFELFVLYLLYKLIFDFIIPVYQTTKSFKQKMGDMQQKMEEHERKQQVNSKAKEAEPKVKHDYIDYEEIK